MIDTCTITRRGGQVTTDPVTGKTTAAMTPIYTGRCKVQSKNGSTSSPEAGEHSFTVVSRQVHIPANAADVRDGDTITITDSALNLFTVGKQYVVDGFTPDTFDTAARLPVKEVTS
jgi:endonuclease YncB( thermonuclease family)